VSLHLEAILIPALFHQIRHIDQQGCQCDPMFSPFRAGKE